MRAGGYLKNDVEEACVAEILDARDGRCAWLKHCATKSALHDSAVSLVFCNFLSEMPTNQMPHVESRAVQFTSCTAESCRGWLMKIYFRSRPCVFLPLSLSKDLPFGRVQLRRRKKKRRMVPKSQFRVLLSKSESSGGKIPVAIAEMHLRNLVCKESHS